MSWEGISGQTKDFQNPGVITKVSVLYIIFPLIIYFTHGSVYMSVLLSQFIQSSFTPRCAHMYVLYICVCILNLQIGSSVPFF